MKVILQQEVKNLGITGETVDVADGYARNFLIPRGLAVQATKPALRTLENERKAVEKKRAREEQEAQAIANQLEGLSLQMPVKAGEGGRLYGSVTSENIADAIQAAKQIEVDRRRLDLSEPIKALGKYEVSIRLRPGVSATVQVEVVAVEEEGKEQDAVGE